MSIEGGPDGWGSLKAVDIAETASGREVFDAGLRGARAEARAVERDLERLARLGQAVECGTALIQVVEVQKGQQVVVVWPGKDTSKPFPVLVLTPLAQVDLGLAWGYDADYLWAKVEGGKMEAVATPLPLAELLHFSDKRVIYRPTVVRWCLAKDPVVTDRGAYREMFLGMGFLGLGPEWMLIAAHEGGHLEWIEDENMAWQVGLRGFVAEARPLHRWQRGKREGNGGVVQPPDVVDRDGLFGLIKKPDSPALTEPTVGNIMRLGLTTHWDGYGGETYLPQQWQKGWMKARMALDEVERQAIRAYNKGVGGMNNFT